MTAPQDPQAPEFGPGPVGADGAAEVGWRVITPDGRVLSEGRGMMLTAVGNAGEQPAEPDEQDDPAEQDDPTEA